MKNIPNVFDDQNWDKAEGYQEGTKIKVLRHENGAKTVLLKLPKNFFMDAHSHVSSEQHFVLEGEYTLKDQNYPKGSFQYFAAHDQHGPFKSKNGAMVLIIWDPIK